MGIGRIEYDSFHLYRCLSSIVYEIMKVEFQKMIKILLMVEEMDRCYSIDDSDNTMIDPFKA